MTPEQENRVRGGCGLRLSQGASRGGGFWWPRAAGRGHAHDPHNQQHNVGWMNVGHARRDGPWA